MAPRDLVVRTKVDPAVIAGAVRKAVWAVDKDQPVSSVRTLDQVFAAAIRRFDIADDARAGVSQALGGGLALYLSWQCTNMAGFAAGASIPASWSLEFAVPLCFVALLAPGLRSTPSLLAAVVAGAAVLALKGLPMKLNLIAAGLIGIVAGTAAEIVRERWTRR